MGALWQTDSSKNVVPTERVDEAPLPEKTRRSRVRHGWKAFFLLLLIILVALGLAAVREMRTSKFQSREASKFAATLTYELQPGPSDAIRYPGAGPFDMRLGYSSLGEFLPRLIKRDYVIAAQTRFSQALMDYSDKGLFVPYQEKIQAGLLITDCRAAPLYQYKYPQQLYASFDAIPPVVVNSCCSSKTVSCSTLTCPGPTLPWTGRDSAWPRGRKWPNGCTCLASRRAAVPWRPSSRSIGIRPMG